MQTNRRTTAFSLLFLLLNKLFAQKRRSHLYLQQKDEMRLILPTLSASARAIAETLIRFHYPVDFIVLASNSAFWRRSAFCNLRGAPLQNDYPIGFVILESNKASHHISFRLKFLQF